uniref:Uncharacterized protein n=1 Tax=Knipowitschia caucasica TaxID=637954 RepID=A0AAV2K389_KNICA
MKSEPQPSLQQTHDPTVLTTVLLCAVDTPAPCPWFSLSLSLSLYPPSSSRHMTPLGKEMVLSGVEELITASEKVDVLESSMHSLAISEKHDDDLEAANDLQNSMIEMEEAVCWEDDDSDEDYVPFLYLRSTGASRAEIDKLPEIHIDEAVLDVEEVETVEDLVGKEASICYNDNLLSLARYMQLPLHLVMAEWTPLATVHNFVHTP